MEPATRAVELNNPSVCTILGAAWDLTELSTAVSSGVGTGLVLSEFKRIVFHNFDERFEPNEMTPSRGV
jgi:hypothetical protein